MNQEHVLKGIPAAPGIAMGHGFILDKQDFVVPPRSIMEEEAPVEIARFEEALTRARREIMDIQEKLKHEFHGQQAKIFDAHLLVLEDKSLIEEVIQRIRNEQFSAEYVFSEVLKKYSKIFANMEDEYLRERGSDINDVGRRVLKNLVEETKLHELDHLTEELILVSHDLSPSDTAAMFNKNIIAFVTDVGGRTSHTAIMAKSLGLPAVVGTKDATLRIRNQNYLIIDGRRGLVIVNPTEETRNSYRSAKERIHQVQDHFQLDADKPAVTLDEHKVTLMANLELPEEIPTIQKYGAEGIGLYRTEYFYMNRIDLPSEEEQFEAYRSVAEKMKPLPVTIRTLDLGGDKFISSLQIPRDMYPFLGWRAIRFCLARPDIFKTQLRAILRASAFGNIKMMYPMISGPSDFRQANKILEEVKSALREKSIPFDEKMPVGLMVEVPSAALTADILAREADFFSIGTNDLIQYTLAVDRVNEETADLYEPSHPAVLRLIASTIEAARQGNIPVSLCGEMASEPILALILLGMGLEDLSMSPLSILQIKDLIRRVRISELRKMAEEILQLSSGTEVEDVGNRYLSQWAPGFLEMDSPSKESSGEVV